MTLEPKEYYNVSNQTAYLRLQTFVLEYLLTQQILKLGFVVAEERGKIIAPEIKCFLKISSVVFYCGSNRNITCMGKELNENKPNVFLLWYFLKISEIKAEKKEKLKYQKFYVEIFILRHKLWLHRE